MVIWGWYSGCGLRKLASVLDILVDTPFIYIIMKNIQEKIPTVFYRPSTVMANIPSQVSPHPWWIEHLNKFANRAANHFICYNRHPIMTYTDFMMDIFIILMKIVSNFSIPPFDTNHINLCLRVKMFSGISHSRTTILF